MPEYIRSGSVEEAVGLIAEHGSSLWIMGGGTIVMQVLESGADYWQYIMGLDGLALDGIERANGSWRLGATATATQIRAQPDLPALAAAARMVGGPALQNAATVGGNIYARSPQGDLAVVLLALDARLHLATADGEQAPSLGEFYDDWEAAGRTPPGLLTAIEFAEPAGKVVFMKCGRRRFNSASVISVAVNVAQKGGKVTEARIALCGAGPHVQRCAAAEEAILGGKLDDAAIARAAEAAAAACAPVTDTVASEWYRRRMVGVYLRRALAQLA